MFASLFAAGTLSSGQIPAATPAPAPNAGSIRFWNALPEGEGELQLVHQAPGGPRVVASASSLSFSGGYIPLNPGRYTLAAIRSSEPKVPLKRFDVLVKRGTFLTILAKGAAGGASVELIDDSFDRAKTVTGKLTIRHFVPGATISVTPSGRRTAAPLGLGEVQVIDDLPLEPILVQLKAALPGGQVREWTTEVDLRGAPRVSLLLAMDPYGRFRPRVAWDGQSDVAAP